MSSQDIVSDGFYVHSWAVGCSSPLSVLYSRALIFTSRDSATCNTWKLKDQSKRGRELEKTNQMHSASPFPSPVTFRLMIGFLIKKEDH